MRATLQAKPLAAALGLAASMVDAKLKKIAALGHARLVAEGDSLTVSANVLDFALKLSLPAAAGVAGEAAIRSEQLAALAAGFPGDAEITIAEGGTTVLVTCGRSRFKLATMPIGDLPPVPEIGEEIGRIELEREQLLELLAKVSFAISTEETRYYLNGVCLHGGSDGLTAVATDGHRLARFILPDITGLSADHRLIVPKPAIKILLKLLGDKEIERLTLRCSATLLEVTSATFTFVSKLIDATYPDYQRILPSPSGNAAIVDRAALAQAVDRIAAVVPDDKRLPLIGLTWKAPEPSLRLSIPNAPELADDLVEAEVGGSGRSAVQIRFLRELLGELKGDRVRIDAATGPGSPILVTDPADEKFLALVLPCVWGVEASQAA
jgi:DNA polymerase-3 subunit beta